MRLVGLCAATLLSTCFLVLAASAQEVTRTELKRADLSGTSMEIQQAVVEVPPGATVPRHSHAGEEVFYVLEGGTVKNWEGKDQEIKLGAGGVIPRGTVHAGFTNVGRTTLKFLTVHVLDKGGPLQILAK